MLVDDDDRRGAEASRLGDLTLERATRVVRVGRDARGAQLGEPGGDAFAGRAGLEREEDVDVRRRIRRDAFLLEGEQKSLDPRTEPDPGSRRPADLLDEVV